MKRCGRCGLVKPLDEFAWRRRAKNQRHNYCRPCHSDYHREHYLANKERYLEQARTSKAKLRFERTAYLIEYFDAHPCADCGTTDPVVLDFDHLRDKKFNVSQALTQRSWDTVLQEIAKCEVVCANCHRRRTAARGNSERFRQTRSRKDKGPGDAGPSALPVVGEPIGANRFDHGVPGRNRFNPLTGQMCLSGRFSRKSAQSWLWTLSSSRSS